MIKIGKVDKKLFLPILGGILYLPFYLIREKTELQNHYIIFGICSSFGMFLAIIPLLISRILMKRSMANKIEKNKSKSSNDIEIPLIYNKSTEEIKRFKFIFIFFSSLTDFTQSLLAIIVYDESIIINFWVIDIIFLSLLSYKLLNIEIYRHQILSMILIIIFGIIMDLSYGSLKEFFHNIGYFLLRIFCEFFFSLSQILNKYSMDIKFSPPYEVCVFIGMYTFFFYLIGLFISSNLPCNHKFCVVEDEKSNNNYFDNFKLYTNKINGKEMIYFVLEMILLGLINILNILTIKYFNPCYSIIILVIGRIVLIIRQFFIEIKTRDIVNIFILILIFLVLLLYAEIIELNFCGIHKNTKENIEKRGDLEVEKDCIQTESINSDEDNNENIENSEPSSYESSILSSNF